MFKSIRLQLLTLALLPAILIATALGLYLSYTRLQDLDSFARERGLATARQFALAAKYAFAENQLPLLQRMASASLEEKGLRSISIFNQQHQLLAHAGPALLEAHRNAELFQPALSRRETDNVMVFSLPINNALLISDIPSAATNNGQEKTLGWVVVEYNKDIFVIKRYEAFLNQNAILFLVILLAALLGYRLGQRLINDLRQLSNAVKRVKEGDTSPEFAITSSHEIQQLADDIASMANGIKAEFDEMRHNIELSTSDLQETIETIEIQNIELSLAQKSAQEASRVKSEFLANTSHEIRTPLNCIIGFTKILKRTPLNTQQLEYLESIQVSSEGLLTIINDILDFSKIEADKLELDEAPFNLRQAFEEILTLFAPSAYDKQIDINLMIYQDVPLNLNGDQMRLKQIISNLLSNAIKFTDSGHIDIRVSLESETDSDIQLSVAITDTGMGLSSQQQKNIFQAFTQANSSISREYGGTGLGLAITKKLVDLMHGDIHLQSKPGQGSTFTFSVTIKTAKRQEPSPYTGLEGKNILLYDAYPLAGSATQHLLEAWGMEVHTCESMDDIGSHLAANTADGIIISAQASDNNERILLAAQELFDVHRVPTLCLLPTRSDTPIDLNTETTVAICAKPITEPKLFRALLQTLDISKQPGFTYSAPERLSKHIAEDSHILVVDDQPGNQKLLCILLQDLGLKVTTANNGVEALQRCNDNNFSLIFMDIQMPVMNGFEATQAIRQHSDYNRETPIIALTAHALADEKQKLLAAGANDYLTKPISEEQIIRTIEHWVAGNQSTLTADVDLHLCLKLANNKPDLASEMFIMLADSLPGDIQVLEEQLHQHTLDDCLELTHRINGACCYTGVPNLHSTCQQLEKALKANEVECLNRLFQDCKAAATAIIRWHQHHDISTELNNIS